MLVNRCDTAHHVIPVNHLRVAHGNRGHDLAAVEITQVGGNGRGSQVYRDAKCFRCSRGLLFYRF